MAQQRALRQPALQPIQPQPGLVYPLAHKGAPSQGVLIHVLNGQVIGVRPAPAPQIQLRAGLYRIRGHLHPGLDHRHPAFLQGMLHGPHQFRCPAGGQEGVGVQSDHVLIAIGKQRRIKGSAGRFLLHPARDDQPVQHFQGPPLPLPAGEGFPVPGPLPVQVIKPAAKPPVQRLDGLLSGPQDVLILGLIGLGAVGKIRQQQKIQLPARIGAAQHRQMAGHGQRLLPGREQGGHRGQHPHALVPSLDPGQHAGGIYPPKQAEIDKAQDFGKAHRGGEHRRQRRAP